MPLEICVLASGSAGNAAILRSPSGILLIDAGIGPRTLSRRLDGTGVRVTDIAALCLTHLDADHFSARWASTLLRLNIPIYCHANKVDALASSSPDLVPLIRPFDVDAFLPIDGLTCDPIHFAHDQLGSHGFVVDGFGYRIGYATDLGHVPSYFFDRFRDLDCIALEANYDRQMQVESASPSFLKRRIMGGHGHLSNLQALAAIRNLLDRTADCQTTSCCCTAARSATARILSGGFSAPTDGSRRASLWRNSTNALHGWGAQIAATTSASS